MIFCYYKVFILLWLINYSLPLINQNELVKQLLYLVEQNSTYSNVPGQNILYYKEETFYCDCSGMIKALLNGYDIYNVKEGSKPSDFPITGDLNSRQLIDGCEDVSKYFYTLAPFSSPDLRFVYMEGHIGIYIGQEIQCGENKDEICNVVECTSSWSKGIQLSYVDGNGNRYNKKGGKKEFVWEKHGLPTKWVEYDCKYIFNPDNATDCVLSVEDKKKYQYCCYEKSYTNKCSPFTQEEYEIQLLTIDALKSIGTGYEFECGPKYEGNVQSSDCEKIKPKKASDCKLSDEDKKKFKYCCYEGIKDDDIGDIFECSAYTQKGYEEELEDYNLLKQFGDGVFMECNVEEKEETKDAKEEKSNSYFFNYFKVWIIFLWLLL